MNKKIADLTYVDAEGNIRVEHVYIPNGAMRFVEIEFNGRSYTIDTMYATKFKDDVFIVE